MKEKEAENKQIIDSTETAEAEAEVSRPGRVILCSRCHKGGGTLVKLGDGSYVHQHCGRF